MHKISYNGEKFTINKFSGELDGNIALLISRGKSHMIELDTVYEKVKTCKVVKGDYKMQIPRVVQVYVYVPDLELKDHWQEMLKEELESRNHMILEEACKVIVLGR